MLIFAIDDEKLVLEETMETIQKAVEKAEIKTYMRGNDALNAIKEGAVPDIVFSDIEMPGISGLEFAIQLKNISPNTRIVFATAYEKYAVEAFKVRAHGYILKPISVASVREELEYLPEKNEASNDKLVINCFGHFDVFYKNQPVIFTRKQSKELLAYLVDRQGAACSREEIAVALWENNAPEKAELQRIRSLLSDLNKTLKAYGMEKVLIVDHRQIAVNIKLLDCDYYKMLEGDMDCVNAYQGEYMKDYSWAEITNVGIHKKFIEN